MTRLSTAVAIALVVIAAARGAAQRLSFETASIRPSTTADDWEMSISPGGNLRVVNIPLRALITFAYGLQNFQLDGGPDWVASSQFDIIGRANGLLGRVDYRKLSAERRKAYEQAKHFIEGAEGAIRDSKFEYALELADKAETLAKELQG